MLTENGIIIERFPEILSDIEKKQREKIDPAIVNRDDQILSEINVILSERLAKANEFIESVRDSWDIAKAEGIALDNLLALKKVFRMPESKSFTNYQTFTGQNGVTVPSGRILRNPNTGDQFRLINNVTLDLNNCSGARFKLLSTEEGDVYTLTINDVSISYTVQPADTFIDIVLGIDDAYADYLSNTSSPLFVLSTSNQGSDWFVTISEINLPLRIVSTPNYQTTYVVARGNAECTEFGPVIAPENAVDQLVIPVQGIISTTNTLPYVLGRFAETDEEYRLRGIKSVSSDGTATVPAISSSLFNNVAGVQSVLLVENASHLEDIDGRPPHSYEVVVVGGDNEDIGRDIWRTKPSGIRTVGNTEVIFEDSNNNLRTVYFTRPTPVIFAVRVTYTLYDEEIFAISGTSAIRSVVMDYINNLGVGVDLIPTRLFGPIYSNVAGIDSLLVEVQIIAENGDAPDPGEWEVVRQPISDTQYSSTSSVDIYIVES